MTTTPKPLSWKAKRHGPIYCAPACGGGCTWQAYQEAKNKAAALARRLGKGWVVKIHENLGWHYSAISSCGRVEVSQNAPARGFTAYLREAGEFGGTFAESGRTPEAAVKSVVAVARKHLARIAAMVVGL